MFRDAVNSNLAAQDYGNIHLKKSKNLHSFKELVHGLVQNFEIFSSFCFWRNSLRKGF